MTESEIIIPKYVVFQPTEKGYACEVVRHRPDCLVDPAVFTHAEITECIRWLQERGEKNCLIYCGGEQTVVEITPKPPPH